MRSKVEERRGAALAVRFPSPLIEPDVRISRIRLSDWLHRGHAASVRHQRHECLRPALASRHSLLGKLPELRGALQACAKSPTVAFFNKHTRSQGPFLHRRYPASSVLRPCPNSRSSRCPTAPLRPLPSLSTGLPRLRDPLSRRAVPITPVDRSRCVCRLLPQIVLPSPNSGRVGVHNFPFEACSGFIRITARRVARPPEADPGLRRGRLLSQGFDPADCSTEPPASYRANRPLPGWDLHPQGDRPLRGAPEIANRLRAVCLSACATTSRAKRHLNPLRETCISILCQEGGGPAWLAPRRPWRGGSR